jgi:hypothetical protein
MYVELAVRDGGGRLLARRRMRARTWVGNAVGLLSSLLKGGAAGATAYPLYAYTPRADVVDVGGAARGILMPTPASGARVGAEAPEGDDSFGIQVGTGTGAVAIGQYALQAKVAHGTASGQLYYGATSVANMVKDAEWSFTASRPFTNKSGASITVYEVGLVVRILADPSTLANVLLARDVISGGMTVPANAILTVSYTVKHSV